MALTMPSLALTMPGLALTMPARSSPNTSAASIRTWVGWALGWAPLDMHASGIWAAVQGAHLKPLFGKPPRLPENHRWVFALIDAGVPSDLSASSPTFLMGPGQDVLHGTMCTGKADGTDHVEHEARERTDEQTQAQERYCSEVQSA